MKHYLVPIMLVMGLLATGSASASDLNVIGPVSTWALPGNHDQRVDDKVFSYIANSSNWSDFNNKDLVTLTAVPALNTANLTVTLLTDAIGGGPYRLDYSVEIDPGNGLFFGGSRLDTSVFVPPTSVTKTIYGSLFDLTNSLSPLLTLTSLDGDPDPDFPPLYSYLPPLKKVWVRDTVTLPSSTSILSTFDNTFFQTAVPEIDPSSSGSVVALLMGVLGFVEQRTRRMRSLLGAC